MIITITPKKILQKQTKKGDNFVSVLDENDNWHSCFEKNMNLLEVGKPSKVELKKNGDFSNITMISQGNSTDVPSTHPSTHPSTQEITQESQQYPQEPPQEISGESQPPQEPYDVVEQASEEDTTQQINTILDYINRNVKTLNEDALSSCELKLSALNAQLGNEYSQQHSDIKLKELDFKKQTRETIEEMKSIYPEKTPTEIKQEAEKKLWEQKAELVIEQNKVKNYEISRDDIKNIIFALKDRLKYLGGR